MKIKINDGDLSIDNVNAGLYYTNIKNFYADLQLSERSEEYREEIAASCNKAAEAIYELQDLMRSIEG